MSFPTTYNLNQDWQDVAIASNGAKQVAVSSNDVYLSLDSGISWSRQSIKAWPPETNFPLGDPFWNITGTGVWYQDYENFQDDYVSIATFGQNNAGKSYSIYTYGIFESGELDFYWRLRKRSSLDNVVLNFYVSKFNTNNILEKTLISGLSINQLDSSWTSVRYVLPESGYYNFEWQYSQSTFTNPATGWIDTVLLPSRILNAPLKDSSQELLPFSSSKTGELLFSNNSGDLFNKIANFDLNFRAVSISSSGQYQAISTNNFVYISNDFGNTWILSTGSNGNWSDVSISNDGKYIIVGGRDISKINSNSGNGFWQNLDFNTNFVKVAMSDDGGYQTLARRSLSSLRRSASYGESFLSVGPSKIWSAVSMSKNGEYQTALASGEYIYVSNNYGLTWLPVMTGIRENWSDVKVSSNGQFQFASVLGGNLYFSNNYGQFWSGINLIKNWRAVSLNDNASILTAVSSMGNVYYSYDSGSNWTTKLKLNNWLDVDMSNNGDHQLLINSAISETQVSYINFYKNTDKPFIKTFLGRITGYGLNSFEISGFGTGIIIDPTGQQFQPAIIYNTGLLTGQVPSNSLDGTFTWNLNLTGVPISGQIFLEQVTGLIQSSGIIEFLDMNGSGLIEGDTININDISYIYRTGDRVLPFEFLNPSDLINIFNSGAVGEFNNLDGGTSQNEVGITGYKLNNKLILFSFKRLGSLGNEIRLSRNSNNLNSIKIPNRYFMGGDDLRSPVNIFTGNFFRRGSLTIENSGIYSASFESTLQKDISYLAWIDTFSGNWGVLTGLISQGQTGLLSPMLYNSVLDKFIGTGIIPSGRGPAYTGLNIQFFKKKPYDISGNLVLYNLSGKDFIYSGILEG
jgi:photosystem II stability/assembly factor-like uncharacterized protein